MGFWTQLASGSALEWRHFSIKDLCEQWVIDGGSVQIDQIVEKQRLAQFENGYK